MDQFPQTKVSIIQGTAVAVYEIGCAFGALSSYFIGDWLGRKKCIYVAGTTATIGVIIQCSSYQLAQLIVGRVCTGLGVGLFTATVPAYIAECSNAKSRGKLVLLCGSLAILGVFTAAWIDFGFYYVTSSSVNWRFPVAFQLIFPIFVLCSLHLLPESPRWLVKKGRVDEAAQVFARLEDCEVNDPHVVAELTIIQQSLTENESSSKASPFAMTENKHLLRTLLAIFLNMGKYGLKMV